MVNEEAREIPAGHSRLRVDQVRSTYGQNSDF